MSKDINSIAIPYGTYGFGILTATRHLSQDKGKGRRAMVIVEIEAQDNKPVAIDGEERDINGLKFKVWLMADTEGKNYSTGLNAMLRGVGAPVVEDGEENAFDEQTLVGLDLKGNMKCELHEQINEATGEVMTNPFTDEPDTFVRRELKKIYARPTA